MKPTVSVIMPAYNCEKHICKAINSILNQTEVSLELLIGDDASTDGTWAIIDAVSDSRVQKFRNDVNIGALNNYNLLMTRAQGEYLTFQDNDDWSEPNRLEKQLSVFDQHPDVSLVVCSGSFYYNENWITKSPAFQSGYISNENEQSFILPAMLFRRNVLDSVKGLHSYFDGAHSWDRYFVLNILSQFKGYAINEYLYTHRFNVSSISRNLDNFRKATAYDAFLKLKAQRLSNESDWLQEKRDNELMDYEKSLLKNRSFMAKKYREYAVYKIDGGSIKDAFYLLLRAFIKNPFEPTIYRTAFYGLRRLIIV